MTAARPDLTSLHIHRLEWLLSQLYTANPENAEYPLHLVVDDERVLVLADKEELLSYREEARTAYARREGYNPDRLLSELEALEKKEEGKPYDARLVENADFMAKFAQGEEK